jgi:putative oxidoreductase
MKKYFNVRTYPMDLNVVLLIIRFICAYVFAMAGWGKIQNPMGWMGPNSPFPGFLLALAAIAEFAGGIALAFGLISRLAALGLVFTMIGAVYFHAFVMGDPFINMTGGASYQPAVCYLLFSLLLLVAGPGNLSLDVKIFGRKET